MCMMIQDFLRFKHVTVNNPTLPVSADIPEGHLLRSPVHLGPESTTCGPEVREDF